MGRNNGSVLGYSDKTIIFKDENCIISLLKTLDGRDR